MAVSVYDAEGNMRDIVDIMSDVGEATKGMTQEQKNFALSNVFSIRSLRGANMALQAGEERMKFLRTEINNSTGAAQEMAEFMEGGVGGAFRRLRSQTADLGIQIGGHLIPVMESVVAFVSKIVERFANLDSSTQKLIIAITGAVAAIGLMSKAIGIGMTMAANYAGAIKLLTVATTAATVKFKAMDMVMKATTIGAVIAVVVAGVAAFKGLSNAMNTTTAETRLLTEATNQANAETAREVFELQQVNKKLEQNKDNKEAIKEAVLELQRINPTYFANLDTEKTSYDDLSKAVLSYSDSIKKAAEARVLNKMLDEQLEAVAKFEGELAEKTGRSAGKMNFYSKLFGDQRDVRVATKGLAEAQSAVDSIVGRLEALKEEDLSLSSLIVSKKGAQEVEEDAAKMMGSLEAFREQQRKDSEESKRTSEEKQSRDKLNAMTLGEVAQKQREFNQAVGESLNAMDLQVISQDAINVGSEKYLEFMTAQTAALFENSAAISENNKQKEEAIRREEAMQSATELGVKVMREAVGKNIKTVKEFGRAVLSSALDTAKAKALEGIFSAVSSALQLPYPINIIAAGSAAGAVSILFNNLQSRLQPPKLAEGGIAYGRTLAEVGEYQGARSNPEVIAPLSKLKDILGGVNNGINSMTLAGDFRISGQDLLLTQIRAKEYSNRQGRN
jgi:hypothetical protein